MNSVIAHSPVKLFAEDVYSANTLKGCTLLQDDLFSWASRWQLKLNPTKCEALMITNKCQPIHLLTPLPINQFHGAIL